jgi:hypothetical protein
MPFSTAAKNAMLDALPSTLYGQLHIGAPGAAGTSNPATETDRAPVTMAAASSGIRISSGDMDWTGIAGPTPPSTETISHLGVWSASSSGTFYGSGPLGVSKAVSAGDDISCVTGDLALVITDP